MQNEDTSRVYRIFLHSLKVIVEQAIVSYQLCCATSFGLAGWWQGTQQLEGGELDDTLFGRLIAFASILLRETVH